MACGELRGFAALTETTEPEAVVKVVREFHVILGELVFRYEGTLATISGGGFMVIFNDPVVCPDPAERAVGLALAMQSAIQRARQSTQARAGQTLIGDRVYGAVRELVDAEPVGESLPREFVKPITAYDVRKLTDSGAAVEAQVAALSPREREVAALVASGLTNREVAARLVVTDSTAAKHIENILGKLGFSSRAQIAAWAVRHGLAPDSD